MEEFDGNSLKTMFEKIKDFITEECKGTYDINKRIKLLKDGEREEYIFVKKIR